MLKTIKIAIIGGGPGGLFAAHELQKHTGLNIAVTIFEAADRLGGKVLTRKFTTAPVAYEAGAAEFYDYSLVGEDPLRQLISEFGLSTYPLSGETVILDGHILTTYSDIRRAFGAEAEAELRRFARNAANAVSPAEYYESDWKADNDDPLSRYSFHALLKRIKNDAARRYVAIAVHSDIAAEPRQTSAMYGLQNWLMNDPAYMRLYRIAGGNEQLITQLITRSRARHLLRTRVHSVEPQPDGTYEVLAQSAAGPVRESFDFVVAALPNNWLNAIRWKDENLARVIEQHHAHYNHPAHYLRVSVLFRRPFWRHRIADSYFMMDAFGGCCVYNETPSAAENGTGYGVLCWLLGGDAALTWSNADDESLTAAVLATVPAELGDPHPEFLEARVHRWVGSVNALPGGRQQHDPAIRHQPDPINHPRILLCGDYLFDSTLNGVLDSAGWVVEEIVDILQPDPSTLVLQNTATPTTSVQ